MIVDALFGYKPTILVLQQYTNYTRSVEQEHTIFRLHLFCPMPACRYILYVGLLVGVGVESGVGVDSGVHIGVDVESATVMLYIGVGVENGVYIGVGVDSARVGLWLRIAIRVSP